MVLCAIIPLTAPGCRCAVAAAARKKTPISKRNAERNKRQASAILPPLYLLQETSINHLGEV